jgi:hypothetical protein
MRLLLYVVICACGLAGCDLTGQSLTQTSIVTAAYGRVVDAESGAPLAGFRVALVQNVGLTNSVSAVVTTTDADGMYRLADRSAGAVPLQVWVNALGSIDNGCVYATHEGGAFGSIPPNQEREVNASLARNPNYDPDSDPVSCQ